MCVTVAKERIFVLRVVELLLLGQGAKCLCMRCDGARDGGARSEWRVLGATTALNWQVILTISIGQK